MSSFVTNSNTRRVKRARVTNTNNSSSEITINSSLKNNTLQVQTNGAGSSLVTTQLGSSNSNGLNIVRGPIVNDLRKGSNPDGRDIPLGESSEAGDDADKLANPPFPITFSGPGYLAFEQTISVPFIRGNVHITGDVQIDGTITQKTTPELGAPLFAPVISDSSGNEPDGVTVTSFYETHESVDYFEALIAWTGITAMSSALPIRMTGLPLSNYSVVSNPIVLTEGGVSTTEVGSHLHAQVVDGESYLLLNELNYTSGGPPVSLNVDSLASAGAFRISGWLRKL